MVLHKTGTLGPSGRLGSIPSVGVLMLSQIAYYPKIEPLGSLFLVNNLLLTIHKFYKSEL